MSFFIIGIIIVFFVGLRIALSDDSKTAEEVDKERWKMSHPGEPYSYTKARDEEQESRAKMPLYYTMDGKGNINEYTEEDKPSDENPRSVQEKSNDANRASIFSESSFYKLFKYITAFSESISACCMPYLLIEDDDPDSPLDYINRKIKRQALMGTAAESAIAAYHLLILLESTDAKEDDPLHIYTADYWNDAYLNRISSDLIRGYRSEEMLDRREKIYSSLLDELRKKESVDTFLSEYIDFHCQMLLALLLNHEFSLYLPLQGSTYSSESKINSDPDILYQISPSPDISRITGNIIEPRIKKILYEHYDRFFFLSPFMTMNDISTNINRIFSISSSSMRETDRKPNLERETQQNVKECLKANDRREDAGYEISEKHEIDNKERPKKKSNIAGTVLMFVGMFIGNVIGGAFSLNIGYRYPSSTWMLLGSIIGAAGFWMLYYKPWKK